MTTKKKLVLAFSGMGILVVGLIVALVAVLAAFTASTSGGGFTVTYTVANSVDATITAGYYVGEVTMGEYDIPQFDTTQTLTTIKTTDGADSMVFTSSSSAQTKSFEKPQIELSQGQALVIRYKIQNDNPNGGFWISGTANYTGENVEVLFTEGDSSCIAIFESRPNGFVYTLASGANIVESAYNVNGNGSWWIGNRNINTNGDYGAVDAMYMYFMIRPEDATKDCTFDGAFNFTLVGEYPESE